jgi:hypothetical protein
MLGILHYIAQTLVDSIGSEMILRTAPKESSFEVQVVAELSCDARWVNAEQPGYFTTRKLIVPQQQHGALPIVQACLRV